MRPHAHNKTGYIIPFLASYYISKARLLSPRYPNTFLKNRTILKYLYVLDLPNLNDLQNFIRFYFFNTFLSKINSILMYKCINGNW